MPDLLLVNCHRKRDVESSGFCDWLGVHLLAAYMEECGYTSRVFAGYTHEAVQTLASEIPNNVKVVGFTVDYDNWPEVARLSRMVIERYNIPVFVGGPQAVALGADFLRKSGAIAIIRGEGEKPLLGLMQYIIDDCGSLAEIPGLVYLENGEEKITPLPAPITNLDALPFINPDLALDRHFRNKFATVITARGCPFKCAFCYEGANTRTVRWRSVGNVMAELEQILFKSPHIKFVLFVDDTFTLNKKRITEFCRELASLRSKRDFCWFAEAHAATITRHPEIMPMMVESGLGSLQIGVESGSGEVLSAYNKKTSPQMLKEAVRICHEANVPHMVGNIIVGGALETRETFAESRKAALELLEIGPGMLELRAIFFWPLPNTAMTRNPAAYGLRIDDPQSFTSMYDYPTAACGNLEPAELSRMRESLDSDLTARMKELCRKLPLERVMLNLEYYIRYGVTTFYGRELYGITRFRRAADLRESGVVAPFENIPPERIWDYYPQRFSVPVCRDGICYADNTPVSESEYRVLLYAAGKLTCAEAARKCGMEQPEYLEIVRKLEADLRLGLAEY